MSVMKKPVKKRSASWRDNLIRKAQNNPDWWIGEVLGANLWERQVEICRALVEHERVAVPAAFGVGKCVHEDERIVLADGRLVKARDLVNTSFSILAFNQETQDQVPSVAWAADNGIKSVYRVTTKSGRQIIRTGNHPLYSCEIRKVNTSLYPTNAGWRSIDDLTTDLAVAVPIKLDVDGIQSVDDDSVKLLGYLLGDGGTTNAITFTQKEGPAKDEFRVIAERYGGKVQDLDALSVIVRGGEGPQDWRKRGKAGRNPVLNLVRSWGLFGCTARDKRFPDWVWALPNRQLAILLNRLFACDGWAAYGGTSKTKPKAEIGITSASERLIRDVELALLRLGIYGTVSVGSPKHSHQVGYGNRYWTWSARKSSEVLKFSDVVGIYGKEQSLAKCKDHAELHCCQQHTPQWIFRGLDNKYVWDRVKSIEYLGEKPTVAISVPNHHAYVTTFVEHNTHVAARIVLWFLYNFKPSKVITTAPTGRQVKDLLWKELRSAHSKSTMKLGGEPLTLGLTLNDEQFAVGFSTDDTNMDMFTGYHSPHQMVVFDQAGGIPPLIWDAAEGLMTSGHCRWLAISNTAISDCEFANICMPERKSKHGDWHIIPITAHETPNVKAGRNIIPGLISYDWVEKRRKAWGQDDPLYQIFVEARFVPTAQMLVIPYPYLLKAYDYAGEEGDVIEIGLDVATVGLDSTVWFARSGERALEIRRMTGNDEMGVAGETIEFVRYVEQKYGKPVHQIKVDVIGPGGGVYSRLIEQDLPVVPVNNAEVRIVIDRERYSNVRAEMAWSLRHRMEHGGVGLAAVQTLDYDIIDMLKADLQIMKYKITSAGKIQILSKDDIRTALGRSPDYWDAMVMAYENPGGGPPMIEFMTGQEEQGNTIISKVLTDDEWKSFIGDQVDIDDPSFHEAY